MRREGLAKLTGQTRYLADLPLEDGWWGATVRSPSPRGRIRAIHFDGSVNWSEFTRVDHRDIPGQNAGAFFDEQQPVLAVDQVRHMHEPVLLLAHRSRQQLRRAVQAVTVVVDNDSAALDYRLEPDDARRQMGDDNVIHRTRCTLGDADAVFRTAARVVEGIYETGAQEHVYLEPQAMLAVVDDRGITVRGSLQCPGYVQPALARVFALDASAIRVVATPVGGGFGGKEDYPSIVAAHAALLARSAGRPVRLVYDRAENLASTTKRHAARIRHRTAVGPDGELLAMEVDILLDGGAYATLSPIVLNRATIHATGPYRCPHVTITGRARMTNTVPSGAFRGFGNPQVSFAIERHIDRIADTLGLDPVAVRRRNLLRDGDELVTGQRIADGVDAIGLLDQARAMVDYDAREQSHVVFNQTSRWHRRGFGCASSYHGTGLPGFVEELIGSRVELEVATDGTLCLRTSIVEMGQGVDTVFAELVAGHFGMRTDEVQLAPPDTALVPDSGPSVASRTSMVVGLLIERACSDLRRQLGLSASAVGDEVRRGIAAWLADSSHPPMKGRAAYASATPAQWDGERLRGDAYPAYGWAAQIAEVDVDLRTGVVEVLDLVSVQDVGTVLHPALAQGQVQGGVVQAAGWALLERVVLENGGMRNASLTDYIIPTSADLPAIRVAFVETPSPHGARGARGLGELPAVGPAGAIANAISRALGVPIDRIPAIPEDVLSAHETAAHDAAAHQEAVPAEGWP